MYKNSIALTALTLTAWLLFQKSKFVFCSYIDIFCWLPPFKIRSKHMYLHDPNSYHSSACTVYFMSATQLLFLFSNLNWNTACFKKLLKQSPPPPRPPPHFHPLEVSAEHVELTFYVYWSIRCLLFLHIGVVCRVAH